ncbi:MarR family winged helix-turn-helix transcriptional regulator [Nocardioides convexus]|uniref:MarR family winged helix-turn-helix transcriptional regulator n=1 Tax=Nocardioides convexus TaxID=2712224 RepID=UPI002418B477|nr:MarR family winged helix-turn-helix transcriptional regulator [Nocardioides convexus]
MARRGTTARLARLPPRDHPAAGPARRGPAPRPRSLGRRVRDPGPPLRGRRPGSGWPRLAASLAHSRSRVTHTVKRMESAGLVRRGGSTEDGRGVVCRLTDAGLEMLRTAAPDHVETVRQSLIDLVPNDDLMALGRVMDAVCDQPDRGAPGARAPLTPAPPPADVVPGAASPATCPRAGRRDPAAGASLLRPRGTGPDAGGTPTGPRAGVASGVARLDLAWCAGRGRADADRLSRG